MQVEPMIVVKDVLASSAWYERLLGCKNSHGGSEFGMLTDGGTVLLLLHHARGNEHGFLRDLASGPVGAGVNLYVRVTNLDEIWERAQQMGADVVEPPHENALAHQRELELRDPDGYYVTICQ